jgi:hypothetical protein
MYPDNGILMDFIVLYNYLYYVMGYYWDFNGIVGYTLRESNRNC